MMSEIVMSLKRGYESENKFRSRNNYHLISRFTAIPQKISKTKTMGIAAIVSANSAEFDCSTMMSNYLNDLTSQVRENKFIEPTCIVTPAKQKKSNLSKQIMI